MDCSTPASMSLTITQSLPKFISIEAMMLSNHLILCWPIFLLPSVFPSIRVFPSELALCIRWSKYWSFSFSYSPPSEYSGLIFLYNWLVTSPCCPKDSQESSPTPRFESINSSVLSFFMVQLSHLYMTTAKTIALTRGIFVHKVMSLLFNTLSRFAIGFLPSSKHLNFGATISVYSDFGAQ